MIGKTIEMYEKLENKLRNVVSEMFSYFFFFCFFHGKNFLWGEEVKLFHKKIKKDGGQLIKVSMGWRASLIFQLLTRHTN